MMDNICYSEGHGDIFFPSPLKAGDKIAMVSPASAVKEEYVYGAFDRLASEGFNPVLMPHALQHVDGNFASTKSERLSDLFEALLDPDIKAIFANRGGYGCAQLLDKVSRNTIAQNPKWIIGFSDISALLALWHCSGVASIHGPMAKHLATSPADDPSSRALFSMLENGGRFDYSFPSHEFNKPGKVVGKLVGGNLAVLNDLAATPYDLLTGFSDGDISGPDQTLQPDIILFIEDINEPIYKVNRILWRLYLSGTLNRVKGIIFGQFTDYKPDKNFSTMEDMINHFINHTIMPLEVAQLPVAYNFPVGHTDSNYPLTVGATVEFEVSPERVRLRSLF